MMERDIYTLAIALILAAITAEFIRHLMLP